MLVASATMIFLFRLRPLNEMVGETPPAAIPHAAAPGGA
jgi:hypothetical protein